MNKALFVVIILFLAILILVFALGDGEDALNSDAGDVMTEDQASPSPDGELVTPGPGGGGGGGGTSLSYEDAIKIYAGRRMQIDDRCQFSPNEVRVKSGDKAMFDNRTATNKSIGVGGKSYTVKAWDFRILTIQAPSPDRPATVGVDCEGQINVASFVIQN